MLNIDVLISYRCQEHTEIVVISGILVNSYRFATIEERLEEILVSTAYHAANAEPFLPFALCYKCQDIIVYSELLIGEQSAVGIG